MSGLQLQVSIIALWKDVEGHHNTGGADLDSSYQLSQDDATTE